MITAVFDGKRLVEAPRPDIHLFEHIEETTSHWLVIKTSLENLVAVELTEYHPAETLGCIAKNTRQQWPGLLSKAQIWSSTTPRALTEWEQTPSQPQTHPSALR